MRALPFKKTVFAAGLPLSLLLSCSDSGNKPKLLSQDGYQGPPGGTGSSTTPPTGSDGGSSSSDSSTPEQTPVESHRYAWCTGKLDPDKVYYAGRSIIYGEDHAIFDLTKPTEFCLAMPLYDPPVMRADGTVVYLYKNATYEWAPDDAVRYSADGQFTQRSTDKLIANDKVVPSTCPAASNGQLGSGLFFDAEKNSAVHICYQGDGRYREDGSLWDTAGFQVYTSHPSGARLGMNTTNAKLAVRKASGEIVDVPEVAHAVTGRNRTTSFWVVDEKSSAPYVASLWEVAFDGTATKIVDYATPTTSGSAYHATLDGQGSLYERISDVIVKRPVTGGPVEVVFDDKSATKPPVSLGTSPPSMPLQFSANGGLFSGP